MFKYLFLPRNVPFSIPKEMSEFKCLILIEREVGEEYRDEISRVLVKAGCLYALAWGIECSAWDDSIDWAYIQFHEFDDCPEEQFVTTTWHEDETLEEVVEFAKHCNAYDHPELKNTLVLDFSHQERGEFIKELYLAA